ncbi:MAG TPA: Imm15 family immunity protein [Pirellulales bacterium]|nr:Imm15 family immunity protein [Pirellulales bacterium]
MAGMTDRFEDAFRELFRRRELDDYAVFSASDYCDEVPLYARFDEISFLHALPTDQANAVLLRAGLDYLDSLVAQAHSPAPFVAALTIWDDGDADPIVPRIFVCNDIDKHELRRNLVLEAPRTSFARRIAKLIETVWPGRFEVFEDDETCPDALRVVVSHKVPARERQIALSSFGKDLAVR